MQVDLIDIMGTDLTVVNAARVSFNKFHDKFEVGDKKLIEYLAKHNHWSPFAHPQVSFRIKAPIFVARQLVKHQIGLTWNEVSRRYIDTKPEFYIPKGWRKRATDKKQGSGTELVDFLHLNDAYKRFLEYSLDLYRDLLENDTAPEQARLVLPLSTYTEWVWTGSLYAFSRVCNLRLGKNSQLETREIAKLISEHMEKLFPISWKVLINVE